jgi:hypothetical protein
MKMRDRWAQLDAITRRRLDGQDGADPFREGARAVIWLIAYEMMQARIAPQEHMELELVWYGARLPGHPLHRVRRAVNRHVADWLEEADEHVAEPLPQTFAWLDAQAVALERFIDGLLPGPAAAPAEDELRITDGAG